MINRVIDWIFNNMMAVMEAICKRKGHKMTGDWPLCERCWTVPKKNKNDRRFH